MSQSADLLALLSDGHPHEMRSIHRAIGFCRLNSRVSELRKRGHNIVCDKSNREYIYTLISRPLAEPGTRSVLGVAYREAAVKPPRLGGDRLPFPASSNLAASRDRPAPRAACGSDVLPTHEAPRVEASVTAPFPRPLDCSVLPSGQLTLQWAA